MKKIIYMLFLGMGTLSLTSCGDAMDEITSVVFSRPMSPTDLEAKVRNDINLELTWTAMNGAKSYAVEVYEGTECSGTPIQTAETETNTYMVKGLEGETTYTCRVQCIDADGKESKWSEVTRATNAEQIMKSVNPEELFAKKVTLRWPEGEKATEIVLTPGDIKHAVTADEIAAGAATIEGLTPETEYEAKLMNGTKTRGSVKFTTLIDFGDATPVYEGDDLLALLTDAAEGAEFILVNGTFDIGNFALDKSLKISGFKPSDKPTINGRFTVATSVASLSLNNLIIDGMKEIDNLLELTDAAGNLAALEVNGCEVRNMKKHIMYNNKKGTFGTVKFDNCIIDGIANDSGDGFDFRGGSLTSLTVTNTTISNGVRSLLRCQVAADVTFENCTFYNICTIDDGNNSGLFRMDKGGCTLTVKNLLAVGIGCASPAAANAGTWGRADKLKCDTDFKDVVYFNSPNLWTNACKDNYTSFAKEIDPKFVDAANGDLTIGNEDLKAGDPRWCK